MAVMQDATVTETSEMVGMVGKELWVMRSVRENYASKSKFVVILVKVILKLNLHGCYSIVFSNTEDVNCLGNLPFQNGGKTWF